MDPLNEICKIKKSFGNKREPYKLPKLLEFKYNIIEIKLEKSENSSNIIDTELLNKLEDKKNIRSHKDYKKYEKEVCPMLKVGKSIFIDKKSITLAYLDILFDITKHINSFLAYQTLGNFVYISIEGLKGSWIQYIQYRRPQSFGYGFNYHKTNYKNEYLDLTRLNELEYNNNNNNNNINDKTNSFIKDVLSYQPDGVDMIVYQGDNNIIESRYSTLISFLTLKKGGDYIMKISNTYDKKIADMLYMISILFEKIILYKPILSSYCNSETYLIAKNFKGRQGDMEKYIDIYKEIVKEDKYIINISDDFKKWILSYNNELINLVNTYMDKVNNLIKNIKVEDIPKYNLYRCLVVLDLPDNSKTPITSNFREKNNYIDYVTLVNNTL